MPSSYLPVRKLPKTSQVSQDCNGSAARRDGQPQCRTLYDVVPRCGKPFLTACVDVDGGAGQVLAWQRLLELMVGEVEALMAQLAPRKQRLGAGA